MRRSPLFGLSVLLAGVGCSGGERDQSIEARIDTTAAGRIEVANTGAPGWTTETAWRLEQDLRIGTAARDAPEAEQFGTVVSLASDPRGRIFVLDWLSQAIRVFLPDGTFSHTIGRRGRGPGEFEGAWELAFGPGDTLTVLDDGAMRYSVFTPDGTFVESHPRPIVGYGAPLRARLNDGSYMDWALVSPEGRLGSRSVFYPVRYTPHFERADTFPPIEHARQMVESGRMPLMDFGAFMVAAPDAEGRIWFADSREYRVYRRTLEGDTTLVFSLPVEAAPLGEAERQQVEERWAGRPDLRAEQLGALPGTRPVLYGIVPDKAGHVFVFADVADEPPGTVMDVFRENGTYLGRMTLPVPVPLNPNRSPVVHITQDHLYLVVTDTLDVPNVVRLRMIRPS